MPSISVIIPVYNKKLYIKRALLSVIRQSFSDIEIIVVDDGSTDQSSDVIKSIQDPRIRLISQSNRGASAARNRGITESYGKYIAFLDADDEWLPNFLETIMRLYRKFPDVSACASNYIIKTPDGQFKKASHVYNRMPHWEGIIPNYFRVALGPSAIWPTGISPIYTSVIVIRREVINRVGGFPVGEVVAEDLDTWARIALKYTIAWTSQIGAIYYMNISDSLGKTGTIQKDYKVIETLKNALIDKETRFNKDISNLIGFYYILCCKRYLRSEDRENALRCITNSLKYMTGCLALQPLIYKILLRSHPIFYKIAYRLNSFFFTIINRR